MSGGQKAVPFDGPLDKGSGPRTFRRSGLRVEPEKAQFLVAAAGSCDSRGPRNRRLARRQFEHGEPTVERRCPRIATRSDRAIGRDQHGWHGFADTAAEDVNAGSLGLLDHGVRVVTTASRSPSGTTIAALGNEIRYMDIELAPWALTTA